MTTTKQHLTHLEANGLIRLAQTHPELEFIFRHALVQDMAYKSLLFADRKRLHQNVGETLERLYPDQLDELAPVLGQHFTLAGDNQRALKYFTLAGDVAANMYANAEAAEYYAQALEVVKQGAANSRELIKLYTRLGRVLELRDSFLNLPQVQEALNKKSE